MGLEDLTGHTERIVFLQDCEVHKKILEAGHSPMVISATIEQSAKPENHNNANNA